MPRILIILQPLLLFALVGNEQTPELTTPSCTSMNDGG